MKVYYDECISLEENLAYEIYMHLCQFNNERKGYVNIEFDKDCLNYLGFEITNNCKGKKLLISYVIREAITDVKLIEIHLMTLGINISFLNVCDSNKKKYLVVFIK